MKKIPTHVKILKNCFATTTTEYPLKKGEIYPIKRVINENFVEIDINNTSRQGSVSINHETYQYGKEGQLVYRNNEEI